MLVSGWRPWPHCRDGTGPASLPHLSSRVTWRRRPGTPVPPAADRALTPYWWGFVVSGERLCLFPPFLKSVGYSRPGETGNVPGQTRLHLRLPCMLPAQLHDMAPSLKSGAVCKRKTLLSAKERCVHLLLGTILCLQNRGSSVEIPAAQARHGNYSFPMSCVYQNSTQWLGKNSGPALCSSESWPVTSEGLWSALCLSQETPPSRFVGWLPSPRQASVKGGRGTTCLRCEGPPWPLRGVRSQPTPPLQLTLVLKNEHGPVSLSPEFPFGQTLPFVSFIGCLPSALLRNRSVVPMASEWRPHRCHIWHQPLFFLRLCLIFTPRFFFFFPFIFISWRLTTLQYCSGFCHTLTWISHGFTSHPDS